MPGSIIFKPIEAHLTHDTELITKMDPYCVFMVGNKSFNSEVSKKGGKHPQWTDAVTVPIANESNINVSLKDRDHITKDDLIGSFTIDLQEIESKKRISKWYPLLYKEKPAGEILLVASFQGDGSIIGELSQLGQKDETFLASQNEFIRKEEEEILVNSREEKTVIQSEIKTEKRIEEEGARYYTEQRQTVEPRNFIKEIDVVEIRPTEEEIVVTEPRKVIQEVQYTDIVPVMKTIETIEPRVVKKEIEVMEPHVVMKEIQVVENVPVRKQIEVVENKPVMKEVETFEPQTFTKEIEVIEQVPVQKTVTVTEPVNVKKLVECVEEVVTTETITKKVQPAAVVSEEITTTVGHAEVAGIRSEVLHKESASVVESKIKQEKLVETNLDLAESEYVNNKF